MENIEKERKYTINKIDRARTDKDQYMLDNMSSNKAYIHRKALQDGGAETLLEEMRLRYKWYRTGWRSFPKQAVEQKLGRDYYQKLHVPPLSLDIELAAVCNLACPHCFRQWIATPDKMMKKELALSLIDQAAEMGVPSIKLNWRGEPMMHPNLIEIIRYAKEKGIIEVMMNSNACYLDERACHGLIDAGLDVFIYSFDGGSKQTYEKNRPGRFEENTFDLVYNNIKRFKKIKDETGSAFPFTRIQMVLTKDCYEEQDEFFRLFSDYVDDVSTGAYMERGGNVDILSEEEREKVLAAAPAGVDRNEIQFWKDLHGGLSIETGRLPCEQPFQRLMISYDGRAFMCCYDWGNEHPVGYVSEQSFRNGDKDYDLVMKNARNRKKGFDMMDIEMPKRFVEPEHKVSTLKEIWQGEEISHARELQTLNQANKLEICKKCTFKETYTWKEL